MSALFRHQLGAVVATAVDYTVMIVLVSGFGAAAALGTAIGAASGGVVNFTLARRWIFRRSDAAAMPQARRYAMVSLGSLILNTCGVHALAGVLQYPYVAARLAVSFAVSLLWNFPLQRSFVFGGSLK